MAPKRPSFAENMHSWAHKGPAGSFGALLVGGCGARAVSRKTPIYFIVLPCISRTSCVCPLEMLLEENIF